MIKRQISIEIHVHMEIKTVGRMIDIPNFVDFGQDLTENFDISLTGLQESEWVNQLARVESLALIDISW